MYPDARDEIVQLYLDDIIPNRFQPREVFDEQALKELAVSIREHGVIQPIIVRNANSNGKYEIIAGERRYKASALAGLTKIPAIVRDLDDKESSKVALLENLQRKNLNPIEEARTYQKILEIDQMTQEDLAKTMGKSQSSVANKLRLLSLPEEVQSALLKEQISERHARTLLNVPDAEKQKEILNEVINNKMSVRALEEKIKELFPKEKKETVEEQPQEESVTTTNFVNTSPLMPTAEIKEEASNYGKVTIAPPEGEEMPSGKYLDLGQPQENSSQPLTPETPAEHQDIPKPSGQEAALDNLLNIDFAPTIPGGNDFSSNPVETKEMINQDPEEEASDYFQKPDLPTIDIPESVVNPLDMMTTSDGNYTVETARTKIRELIEDLKAHGINVSADEMNFEKSFQVIIKIDKSNEPK